ncbi:MAG: hypothetical protein V3S55_09515 [Nitrospiraceae bacterium]
MPPQATLTEEDEALETFLRQERPPPAPTEDERLDAILPTRPVFDLEPTRQTVTQLATTLEAPTAITGPVSARAAGVDLLTPGRISTGRDIKNALIRSLARSRIPFISAAFAEKAIVTAPPERLPAKAIGFLTDFLDFVPAIFSPGFAASALGPVIAGGAADVAAQTLEETGSSTAAIGAGVTTGVAEMAGFKIAGKLGAAAYEKVGAAIIKRGAAPKEITKAIVDVAAAGGAVAGIQETRLVVDQLVRAGLTDQGFRESVQNIKELALPTAGHGFLSGVVIAGGGALAGAVKTRAARRQVINEARQMAVALETGQHSMTGRPLRGDELNLIRDRVRAYNQTAAALRVPKVPEPPAPPEFRAEAPRVAPAEAAGAPRPPKAPEPPKPAEARPADPLKAEPIPKEPPDGIQARQGPQEQPPRPGTEGAQARLFPPEAARPGQKEVGPAQPAPVPEPPVGVPAAQARLPGPRKGSTIVLTEVSRTISDIASGAKDFTRATGTVTVRAVQRANTVIRKLGEPGRELAGDIDDVTFQMQRQLNTSLSEKRKILQGLSTPLREIVAQFTDNYTPEVKLPPKVRADLLARSQKLRAVMDEQMRTFAELGGQRRIGGPGAPKVRPVGSGHAFPQVMNEAGRAVIRDAVKPGEISPKVLRAAQWMVEKKHAKDVTGAIRMMREFNERQFRNVNPYLERKRLPMPPWMREWDPNRVLPGTMTKNWSTIEGVRKWGWDRGSQSFPKADALIDRIEPTDPSDAANIREFIRLGFGFGAKGSRSARLISQRVRGVQFFGKIAISPITIARNMIDRYAKSGTTAGLAITARATIMRPPILSAWLRSARELEDQMFRSGAVFGHGSIAEGVEPGTIIGRFAGAAFTASERGNQVFEALVARLLVERDIKAYLAIKPKSRLGRLYEAVRSLNEMSNTALEARLKQANLLDLSTEKLSDLLVERADNMPPVLIQGVMHRAVRDQAFPVILSTKRFWWDKSPGFRVMAQFKTWTVEQIGFIYKEAVMTSIRTRSPLPLMRFIFVTALVGEIYNIARDLILDKEESLTLNMFRNPDMRNPRDVSVILAKDFLDGGGIGMLADLYWGITDWILGPTGGTVGELGIAVTRAAGRPELTPEAMKEVITRELSGVRQFRAIFHKVEAKFEEATNDTALYSIWRSREWDFVKDAKEPTFADARFEWSKRIIFGDQPFEAGRRSFAYQLAGRSVTTGDVEDAAEYLALVINDGETFGERKKINTNIKQSRNRRAPLGRMNDKRKREFLKTLTAEQRTEVLAFRKRWLSRYNQAHKKAKQIATANREKESRDE